MRKATSKRSNVGLVGLLVAGGATAGASRMGYSKLEALGCFVSSLFFLYGIYQANKGFGYVIAYAKHSSEELQKVLLEVASYEEE